jgi:hypothetical protein
MKVLERDSHGKMRMVEIDLARKAPFLAEHIPLEL